MTLIVEGREDELAALLKAGLMDPNATCGDGCSCAMVAVAHGRAECLRVLLASGADDLERERQPPPLPGHPLTDPFCGITLVALAIAVRALDCLRLLLASGARLDTTNVALQHWTIEGVPPSALHWAVEEKYSEGVALLLRSGRVDVHAVWARNPVIQRAYDAKCWACLKLVVGAGADAGSLKLESITPASDVVRISALIEAGCADAEDIVGSTPGHVVSGWRKRRACIRLMKKAGAKALE